MNESSAAVAGPGATVEPAAPVFTAPAHWRRIDFISDLHLAEDTPNAVRAWADYLNRTPADAVFILGDLFEVWVGDDARHEGFEAMCTEVLKRASAKRTLGFMAGNRDFLLGTEMLDACGVLRLQDPTVLCAFGQRVLLAHGDAWCVGDVAYQQFRRQVRDPAWQAMVLAKPLPERRLFARHLRSESERRLAAHSGAWFDVDTPTALQWMQAAQTPTLIHGHTHRPGSNSLAPGFVRHVLSDWDLDHALDHPQDGEPDQRAPRSPARAEVLRWQGGEFTRLAPRHALTGAP